MFNLSPKVSEVLRKTKARFDGRISPQQEEVIIWALTGQGSLNVKARAGCGKTSLLLALTYAISEYAGPVAKLEIFIGAYNSAIAKEVSGKIEKLNLPRFRAHASTLHQAGYNGWRKAAPRCRLDDNKVKDILARLSQSAKWQDVTECFGIDLAIKAVGFAKQRAFGYLCSTEDRAGWFNIIDHFGLEEDMPDLPDLDLDSFVDLCIAAYKESLATCQEIIDFNDMILAPLVHKVRFYPKDWVFIDEAQDTNPARRALALKMVKPVTGRLIAVGDPAQAIYGFTGADSDSMDLIAEQLNSKTLPLNRTFRCPKSVVRMAQAYVRDIEAADTNPEGETPTCWLSPAEGQTGFWSYTYTKEDVILCRNNKPLVELAYAFLRKGIACHVEGREIGAGLIALIRRWKAKKIVALLGRLEEYKEREIQKYLSKGKEEKAAGIEDKCDTLKVLAEKVMEEGKTEVSDLVAFINGLFGDTPEGEKPKVLTLASVHKSKGREWSRVFLLGQNKYMPSKWARKDWQMEQENNLIYVGLTRAMSQLISVVV